MQQCHFQGEPPQRRRWRDCQMSLLNLLHCSLQYCINTFSNLKVLNINSGVGCESAPVVPAALWALAVGAKSCWRKTRMIPYCIGSVSISCFCYLTIILLWSGCLLTRVIWGSMWNIVAIYTLYSSTHIFIFIHNIASSSCEVRTTGHIPVSFPLIWVLIWGKDFKRELNKDSGRQSLQPLISIGQGNSLALFF